MNIMKSPVEPKEELIITTDVNNTSNLKLKENSYLLKHISKLGGNHDVTVSGTMIKVTYKKTLKDHFPSSACFNGNSLNEGSVFNDKSMDHSVNTSDVHISQGKMRKTDVNKRSMCSSDSLRVPKNLNSNFISKRSELPIFHSTAKLDSRNEETKKKDYVNGINLLMKLKNEDLSVNRYHLKPSHSINSQSMTACNKNLSFKLVPVRASTSEKMQPSNIKFPKGITVIKLEENTHSKREKLHKLAQGIKLKPEIKKTTIEKNVVIKDNTKFKIGTKRKIKLEDVATNKIIKNCELNKLQNFKISSKAVNSREAECSGDLSKENFGNNESGSGKKELLLDDPDLPAGWKRVVLTRHQGTPSEKHVVYIYSPLGKKFQFKWKLRRYLEKTKSALSAEQFHFGLYKRTKPLQGPTKIKDNRENVPLLVKAQLPNNNEQAMSSINKSITSTETKAFKLKNSTDLENDSQAKIRLDQYKDKPASNLQLAQSLDSDIAKATDSDRRPLLLFDPDLPFGWKRVINSNNSSGKLQVHIISPEGRIFRRRYRLNEYLLKHQYTHSLDRFYFGLYPKRDLVSSDGEVSNGGTSSKMSSTNEKHDNSVGIKAGKEEEFEDDDSSSNRDNGNEVFTLSEQDTSKFQQYITPMHDDPQLPEGWKRFIKMRSCGKSAGRLEVVIVSPDGKKLRTKRQLEHYLKKNNLSYDADGFDFSVFGRGKKRPVSESKDSIENFKRRSKQPVSSDRPVPDLEMGELKDIEFTREGEMINAVNGIMIACELSSGRSERRLRMPRREHEKILKNYLDSENNSQTDDSVISPCWIQKLVKCRSDFRNLESDAACAIAEKTEEFIKELLIRAFQNGENSKMTLGYEDIANVVDKYECLSSLKTLIPKKITYKEYVKLNRPKQFMSFT